MFSVFFFHFRFEWKLMSFTNETHTIFDSHLWLMHTFFLSLPSHTVVLGDQFLFFFSRTFSISFKLKKTLSINERLINGYFRLSIYSFFPFQSICVFLITANKWISTHYQCIRRLNCYNQPNERATKKKQTNVCEKITKNWVLHLTLYQNPHINIFAW